VLSKVVSDGIIAPGFESGTAEVLSAKMGGRYVVFEARTDYEPPEWEHREVFGIRLAQEARRLAITAEVVAVSGSSRLPDKAVADLVLAMVTARYTQSNSVTYAKAGMVLGVGAGQQSRIDCTKVAGAKVDIWWLRRHDRMRSLTFKLSIRRQERINWQIRYIEGDMDPAEHDRFLKVLEVRPEALTAHERSTCLARLDEVALASDGYVPYRDNIDQEDVTIVVEVR